MTGQAGTRVVVADYGGPGASREAYRLAAEMAGEGGTVMVVHPLDPMINLLGAVRCDVLAGGNGHELDEIDHRMTTGLGGADDEVVSGPLPRAVLAVAHEHGAEAIVVGEDLGLHDPEIPVTVAPH